MEKFKFDSIFVLKKDKNNFSFFFLLGSVIWDMQLFFDLYYDVYISMVFIKVLLVKNKGFVYILRVVYFCFKLRSF